MIMNSKKIAVSVDRTRDLQIFSLTLSQLSYPRKMFCEEKVFTIMFLANLGRTTTSLQVFFANR
ncbi:hypothetical protein LINPERHAP1_LOCUS26375 [Linum perenne]